MISRLVTYLNDVGFEAHDLGDPAQELEAVAEHLNDQQEQQGGDK